MSSEPFFSIIVPVYNVEAFLPDCITSIFNQSYSDFEIIAVEDCSTDSSLPILTELSKRHPIHVIPLQNNSGLGAARNVGIAHAKGKYLLFVDSDDEIEPDLLHKIKTRLDNEDLIVFDYYREWPNGDRRANQMTPMLESLSTAPICRTDVDQKTRLFSNFNVAWNKAYRKDFLTQNNLRFDDGYYEDIVFNYKAIILSEKTGVLPYAGYKYRQRDDSILNVKSPRHVDIMLQYERLYRFIFGNRHNQYEHSLHRIFIQHLFNLLVKQHHRLTGPAEAMILLKTKALIKMYRIGVPCRPATLSVYLKLYYLRHASALLNKTIAAIS